MKVTCPSVSNFLSSHFLLTGLCRLRTARVERIVTTYVPNVASSRIREKQVSCILPVEKGSFCVFLDRLICVFRINAKSPV